MRLDPNKHPFSAALYNKPVKARHRKKSGCFKGLAVAGLTLAWILYMELPVVFG